jgi:hypothetical protein
LVQLLWRKVPKKIKNRNQVQWLTSIIPATQETEIRRIRVVGQPKQKVRETSS